MVALREVIAVPKMWDVRIGKSGRGLVCLEGLVLQEVYSRYDSRTEVAGEVCLHSEYPFRSGLCVESNCGSAYRWS